MDCLIMNDLICQIADDIESHSAFREFDEQISNDFDSAYTTQDKVVTELIKRGTRASICGYKIALNAKPLMEHFGVSEPISGQLFEDQRHLSSVELPSGDFRSLLIEPEIAAVMGHDLKAGNGKHDRESVLTAIAMFVPAFELVDTRDAHIPDLQLTTAIAQNITNEGLVIGGPGILPLSLDVDNLDVTITFDDTRVAELKGSAPQHPLDAVAWLANHLELRGKRLEAGQIVLCGSHMPPKPVGTAKHIRADMGAVGNVEFTILPAKN
jgi:2-keto-4-pentenoate hydratase